MQSYHGIAHSSKCVKTCAVMNSQQVLILHTEMCDLGEQMEKVFKKKKRPGTKPNVVVQVVDMMSELLPLVHSQLR